MVVDGGRPGQAENAGQPRPGRDYSRFAIIRIVNVISRRGLAKLLDGKPPDVLDEALAWFKTAPAARWNRFQDVRRQYPGVDQAGEVLVFNLRHNRYRLIATVCYPAATVYVKALLTHKEYAREEWKKWV
jgi:mRNA interferase HigB